MQPALTSAASAAERSRRRAYELDRPIASALSLDPAHLDVIEQSYQRCAAIGLSRTQAPDFAPLGRTDLNLARERHRRLYTHAAPVMEMLYEQIVNTQSMVVLTDVCGTIIHSIGDDDFLEKASKVALQPGVNWSESAKGTNAIGTALVSESATLVHADEHFMHANHFLTCSAAPIFDPRGNMLGVLDVTGDHRRYHQHTMGLVKMSARMIENHWLSDDFRHVMRLHLHARVECLGTLMEGILAISRDGRVLGANRTALDHLGLSGAAVRTHTVTSLLGTSVGALVDHFRSPLASPLALHLPGGTLCHVQARFDWAAWYGLRHPASSEAGQVTDVEALAPRPPSHSKDTRPKDTRPDNLGHDDIAALPPASPIATDAAVASADAPAQPARAPGLKALDTGDARMHDILERLRKLLDPRPAAAAGRRDRHRQGDAGACGACRLAAGRAALRRGAVLGPPAGPARDRALRQRARRLRRRAPRSLAGPPARGPRRHAVPGRHRRAAAAAAGPAAARAGRAPRSAGGQRRCSAGGRGHRRRDPRDRCASMSRRSAFARTSTTASTA